MRRLRLWLAVFFSFAAAFVTVPASRAQQPADLPHPKTLPDLQKAMKDVLDKAHLPGAGVALVSNGELLWCGGFGKADLASGRDVSVTRNFALAPSAKLS